MIQASNILSKLSDPDFKLSKSEKLISKIILKDPNTIIQSSIAKVAQMAGVSEPTVNRFCHTLSCNGFPEFKLRLAQELIQYKAVMTQGIDSSDSSTEFVEKIYETTHKSLNHARANINMDIINSVIDMLCKARSISFLGMGASNSVAIDAQHKFLRFDTPVLAHGDSLQQRIVAASAKIEDVIVMISYTGRTLEIIEVAKVAKLTGANLIAITKSNSPLAELCDLTIPVSIPENTDIYTPMTSRINQLVVIDILATGFALKKGEKVNETLHNVKEVLSTTRL
jgi:RpiR family carbohydrate utilization transcriptional regulator